MTKKKDDSHKPLAATTITRYVLIVKQIVDSAVDEETGKHLYRPEWDSKFMGLPKVNKKKQKRPSFSSEIVAGLARYPVMLYRVLFILLAATGARIGEMLGIEIDKHISPDFRTIFIRQKVHKGEIQHYLKTDASCRDIDLHPAISAVLREFIGDRKSGLVFSAGARAPLTATNMYTSHLHPALKALGYKNNYDQSHKAGFHAFRRLRNTFLKNFTRCPEGLRNYWLAWAKGEEEGERGGSEDMGDRYDMIADNLPFRLQTAEECGFGFELPSCVPTVPSCDPGQSDSNSSQHNENEGLDWSI